MLRITILSILLNLFSDANTEMSLTAYQHGTHILDQTLLADCSTAFPSCSEAYEFVSNY